MRALEAFPGERRASRPRRGTEAEAGEVAGSVWVEREDVPCRLLAVWGLRRGFGFIATLGRGVRAGRWRFCDRFVGGNSRGG